MGRLHELENTRDKINAEIRMLRNADQAETKAPVDTVGYAVREKTPEEIINELFTYHPPQDEATHLKYETVRDAAKHLAMVIWKACPYGADRTAAIRKLRETVMTANASIALNGLSV